MIGGSRDAWQERSRTWAAIAPRGRAKDDALNQLIVAEAGIAPGEAVLDIASGSGNPAVSIALSLAGKGSVTCLDHACGMLETARGRAANLGLSIMGFVAADMGALPFRDGTLDCVTCRFGIMSIDDKAGAAAEALRVLRPGGRAAYMVWGPYEQNPPFFVPRRAVAAFFGEEEGPVPTRHSMGAPGAIRAVMEAAGFVRIDEREMRYRNEVADHDTYVINNLKRSFAKKLEDLDDGGRARLKRAALDAWAPYCEDGAARIPNCARLGLGWQPG